jgi:hypothetical protein
MSKSLRKKTFTEKFKPSAPKGLLLLIAGSMWLGVGIFLNTYVYKWLVSDFQGNNLRYIFLGLILSIGIHHFGFSKIAKKNLIRISSLNEHPCIFSFMKWQNYFLVIFMVGLGITLRLSPIPKTYLSIIYIGIGLGLVFSSSEYFRAAIKKR